MVNQEQVAISGGSCGTSYVSTTATGSVTPGTKIDMSQCSFAALQIVWSGAGGALDGEVEIEVSNDGTNWDQKSGGSLVLGAAAGNEIISLNGVCPEKWYRVRYTANGTTGGSITCHFFAK